MAAKRQGITGPGQVLDRSAKNGKIKLSFDPSPDGFVGECRMDKGRLTVTIQPGVSDMEPIQISAAAKLWAIQLEEAAIPKDRLADLEALITQEEDVHVKIEYTPAPKLPGMDGKTDVDAE